MTVSVTPATIEEKLLETIAELSDTDSTVTRESTLEALDMDSLDLVELGQIVAEEWGVQLQPDDLRDVKNVGDAIDVVIAKAT